MDSIKTPPEIRKFLQKVRKEFSPEKVILFGSRAIGTEWKQSDYDLIIISPRFQGVHWLDRITKITRLWDIATDVDILPYTPQEFIRKKKESSVIRQALKSGKTLAW